MSDTSVYFIFTKNSYVRRAAAAFLFYLAVVVISCVGGYLYYLIFGTGGSYAIVEHSNRAADFVNSQAFSVIEAALLFTAVFTVCYRGIAVVLCALRGVCLGISAYVYADGCLLGASNGFAWALAAYFLSTVAFLALVSISLIYSEVICATHVSRDRGNMRPLIFEYIKLFLIISGAVFTFGCITVALI